MRRAIACSFLLLLVASLMSPQEASALPNPLDVVPSGLPSLDPGEWIVDGFKALITFVFGDPTDLGRHIINLLIGMPLLTDKEAFPRLNAYYGYVSGGAWGILGLALVVSSMRYWLAGYSGGGGAYEALIGFTRTIGSICMLLMFPIMFDQLSRIVNAFTAALIVNPVIGKDFNTSIGITGTFSLDNIAEGGLGMIITIAVVIMAIVLLVVKVIVTALLAVLFVLAPIAISVWPIEELAWGLRTLVQAMMGVLIFPIVWAVSFATFTLLPADALFPGNNGDIINSLISPLLVLASFIIALRLPFAILARATSAGVVPSVTRGMRTASAYKQIVPSRFQSFSPSRPAGYASGQTKLF